VTVRASNLALQALAEGSTVRCLSQGIDGRLDREQLARFGVADRQGNEMREALQTGRDVGREQLLADLGSALGELLD
jgi:hypothetical protein